MNYAKKIRMPFGLRAWIILSLLLLTGLLSAQSFVVRDGAEFCYKGKKYKFIGINAAKLHWDPGTTGWTAQDVKDVISSAHNMGVKVIRIFLARNISAYQNPSAAITDINRLLGYMHLYDPEMKLLVAFTDVHQGQQMYLPGDHNSFSNNKLIDSWYSQGYKDHYLPFVLSVVEHFKDDPDIFAWELGNELQSVNNAGALISFSRRVGGLIKTMANQMVTTGFQHLQNATANPGNFNTIYGDNSPFDFVTVHGYDDDWNNNSPFNFPDTDINNAISNGIPFVVEELGFTGGFAPDPPCDYVISGSHPWRSYSLPSCATSRKNATEVMLYGFFDELGAEGVMSWSFTLNADVGYGDVCVGMMQSDHPDFFELYSLYSNRANDLAGQVYYCNAAPPCPSTHILSGNRYHLHRYHASNYIHSTQDVKSSAIVSYNAGNQVRLKPGFEARSGAIFRAYIDGCPSPAFDLEADFGGGREERSAEVESISEGSLRVSPNPFLEELQVFTNWESGTLSVYDWTGKQVLQMPLNASPQVVDVADLAAGIYVLEVRNGTSRQIQKIVKQ